MNSCFAFIWAHQQGTAVRSNSSSTQLTCGSCWLGTARQFSHGMDVTCCFRLHTLLHLRIVGSYCAKFQNGQTFSYPAASLLSKRFQASVIARKLERKRKIKRCKREGEGRRGSFFPLPLPRHSLFFALVLDELARKRLLRRLLRGCS